MKAGQVVQVKVLEVDLPRQRVALTMKLHERPAAGRGDARDARGSDRGPVRGGAPQQRPAPTPKRPEPEVVNPLAAQLAKLNLRRN